MKKLLTLFFLIVTGCQIYAQQNVFVRVYDFDGRKINRGRVLSTADSYLQLKVRKDKTVSLPINTIGTIKTKRSSGNNIAIGAAVGGAVFGVLSAAEASGSDDNPGIGINFSPGGAAVLGAFFGMPIGAAIGGLSIMFKKVNTFSINGNAERWKTFQDFVAGNVK